MVVFFWGMSVKVQSSGDLPAYFVPAPPFSEGIYPCSNCHAGLETNLTRRELTYHQEIVLKKHSEEQRWCLDCHDKENRDKLRLASGRLVNFEQSYYLCGQCHGTQFRDWKVGVHGKRTGYWNGEKLYRLCAHCHNPHQPKFKPAKPMPPPEKPGDIMYETTKFKEDKYKEFTLPEDQFIPADKHKGR
jgi:hypothetical protein